MHHPAGTIDRRNVDWLFLDMNAYFASAEQQRQPHLRGKPVAVVPTMTDRTCCIAVSYEARPFGVRTGTNVGDAKRLCPGIQLVEGRHEHYIRIHQAIVKAVETVLPVEKICSIDEMACRLAPQDRTPERATAVGEAVKRAIRTQVGEHLRCSIGLAPNRFLAKVGSNLQKPDGMSIISRAHLPYRLHSLALTDLPGIARNMQRRLAARGVTSTRQLCALSKPAMREIWNSVLGEQWWHWLRGDEIEEKPTQRRTIGHSHVLPPDLRTECGCRSVLVRLLHKAAMRLRKEGYVARNLEVTVRYTGNDGRWSQRMPVGRTQDTPTLLRALTDAWDNRPPGGIPLQAAVTLLGLERQTCRTLPLFPEDRQAAQAARTMDEVNEAIGPNTLYFASMHETREAAPLRIAFTRIPDVASELGG